MRIPDVPVLPGWVNLTEAAEMIGVSRQHSYRMARDGKWKSLHRIGSKEFYVVSVEEVEKRRRH